MSYRIHKQFSWDMAHRISMHDGKCWNLHGHTYFCMIYLKTTELNSKGMVLDYYNLDLLMKPLIDKLDHSCMVFNKDKFLSVVMSPEHTRLAGERSMKVYWVDFESTAENIAKHIYDILRESISSLDEVIVKETPKTSASFMVNEA